MEWWTVAQPWISMLTALVALVLGVANTGWIVAQARRAKRQDAEKSAAKHALESAEAQIPTVIKWLVSQGPMLVDVPPEFEAGAKLAADRGLVDASYATGTLQIRYRAPR
jgi:pectin methylesterase-like acyl-CoA thioesterase